MAFNGSAEQLENTNQNWVKILKEFRSQTKKRHEGLLNILLAQLDFLHYRPSKH